MILTPRIYKNLGTAVLQCTSIAPVGGGPSGLIPIYSNFANLQLNHLPLNYKSIVTLFPETCSFSLQPGTYNAYWNMQNYLYSDLTYSANPAIAGYSTRLRNTITGNTVCKWINSYAGQRDQNFSYATRSNSGDYIHETSFTLTSSATFQLQVQTDNSSTSVMYIGYTSTTYSNFTPFQVCAQLRLEKIY